MGERTDNAVFGSSARINLQGHARARIDSIGEAIARARLVTAVTAPEWSIVDTTVESGINAQITTQLDTGVCARNEKESGTIERADPHVFDRFGLHGKISCLGSAHGEKTRR